MADDRRVSAIVETYAAQQSKLASALIRALLALWIPFRWWGRPDMVNALAAQSSVHVDVANAQVRRLARAYMRQLLRELDALPDDLPDVVDTYERGGTPMVEVYKRPARQVERAIRLEKPPVEQIEILTERIEKLVEADLAATARDEQQKVMAAAPRVIGYRRVIHPELSKTGTCGLCIVASSRFYTRDDLMELHDLCKCTTAPLTDTDDPGLKLNRDDLDRIYAAAGGNYAEDLKRVRVTVHEHGELGPILRQQGQHFRDVTEVNVDSKRRTFTKYQRQTGSDTTAMWDAMRTTSERSIRILEQAKRNGTNLVDMLGGNNPVPVDDIDKAIAYHRALIARAASHGA